MDFQVVVDCWEGNKTLDTKTLLSAGVKGIVVRINDMNGGHHIDSNFAVQWAEAQNYPARTFYFVYNPWVSGQANYDWLFKNAPSDTPGMVMVDHELTWQGSPPAVLAREFETFKNLVKQWKRLTTYTGGFVIPWMTYWPTDVDYWWARYPSSIQKPEIPGHITSDWATVINQMKMLGWNPDPQGLSPVPPKMWQCTSKYILPGTNGTPIDLNIWPDTVANLQAWFGNATDPTPEPPPATPMYWCVVVVNTLHVRTGPSTSYPLVAGIDPFYLNKKVPVYAEKNTNWVAVNPEQTQWCCVGDLYLKRIENPLQ